MASRSWNKVELIGNLTRDPELRYTPSGTAVATIGLATNRTFNTADGEKREEVDFHKIVAWGKLAELCSQLLKKGARVFMSGRLQYREWQGQDGNKRRDAEIVLEDMILLTPKGTGGEAGTSEKYAEAPLEDVSLPEDTKSKDEKSAPDVKPETKTDEKAQVKPNETVVDEDLPF